MYSRYMFIHILQYFFTDTVEMYMHDSSNASDLIQKDISKIGWYETRPKYNYVQPWVQFIECTAHIKYYNDVIINAMASQITSVPIVCSTVGSGADQRKH